MKYSTWRPNQPDNHGNGESCLEFVYDKQTAVWNDQYCDRTHSFACEIDM